MDALSELLKVVKLSGALFYRSRCSAPWCLQSPPSRTFAPYVGFAGSQIIEFHLITEGRGYIRVGEETTPLMAGDIVMLPHGDAHDLGNGSGGTAIDGARALPALISGRMALADMGGGGENTVFVCGYLACEERLIRPALAGLPRVVRVNVRTDASGEWLEHTIRHAVDQAAATMPGSEVIIARLAEVLFAETLRRYLLQLPSGRTGWLAGAGDAVVGRALAALHRRPAHAWTLEELAREASISRSALTERFARYLGQSPMAYLAEWRLELAAEQLRASSSSVQRVALEVGYDSEAAFNRAFKRRFKAPPARYRKEWRGENRAHARNIAAR